MSSAALPSAATRDPRGRFMPGMSGNPAGKRPGTRHQASLWRDLLRHREEGDIRGTVIDRAAAGNLPAALFLCRQLDGPPRRGLIDLGIPLDSDPTRIAAAVHVHLIAGLLSPAEARDWIDVAQRSLALVAAHREADPQAIPFDEACREAAARLQAALDDEEAAERAAAADERDRRAAEAAVASDGSAAGPDEPATAAGGADPGATPPTADDTAEFTGAQPRRSTGPADGGAPCIPPASAGEPRRPPGAAPARTACMSPAFPGRAPGPGWQAWPPARSRT